jgi:hypothetical protein
MTSFEIYMSVTMALHDNGMNYPMTMGFVMIKGLFVFVDKRKYWAGHLAFLVVVIVNIIHIADYMMQPNQMISAGDSLSAVITADEKVVCWGRDIDGQCNVPRLLESEHVTAISCGWYHVLHGVVMHVGSATSCGFREDIDTLLRQRSCYGGVRGRYASVLGPE